MQPEPNVVVIGDLSSRRWAVRLDLTHLQAFPPQPAEPTQPAPPQDVNDVFFAWVAERSLQIVDDEPTAQSSLPDEDR